MESWWARPLLPQSLEEYFHYAQSGGLWEAWGGSRGYRVGMGGTAVVLSWLLGVLKSFGVYSGAHQDSWEVLGWPQELWGVLEAGRGLGGI